MGFLIFYFEVVDGVVSVCGCEYRMFCWMLLLGVVGGLLGLCFEVCLVYKGV